MEGNFERVDDLDNIYRVGRARYALDPGNCFLIDSDKKVLIESGTSMVVDKIVEDLSELGVENLDYIAVTHIHMDHAGGAGFLLDEFPNARVIVHESGIEYLNSPGDLKRSVKRATGEFFEYWGDIKPIPEDSMVPVSGGEKFGLGKGFSLEVVETPGHAPHHVCYYESKSKSMAVGDSVGIYFPEADELIPTTPPPSFDREEEMRVLRDLKDRDLSSLLFTHEGWSETPKTTMDRYREKLNAWVSEIKDLRSELDDEDVIGVIEDRYLSEWTKLFGREDFARQSLEMSTRGVLLYFDRLEK